MNQARNLLNRPALIAYVVMPAIIHLATGCLPIPHTTERSPEIRGRVLDARARTPIKNAKVILTNDPKTSCLTDASGYFQLKATSNFHIAYIPPEGDAPQREYYWADVTVSHTNYLSRERSDFSTDKGDILLEPK